MLTAGYTGQYSPVHIWKKVTLLRLILPMMAGIIFQWYHPIAITTLVIAGAALLVLYLLQVNTSLTFRIVWGWLTGITISLVFFCLGGLLTYTNNITNKPTWIGKLNPDYPVLLTISEPLIKKAKSYKADAEVNGVFDGKRWLPAQGTVLLYFLQSNQQPPLKYGSQIIIKGKLQPIKNSGNPGGFDYKSYCAFRNIYHQAFVGQADVAITATNNSGWLQAHLYMLRNWVISSLQQYISNKKEQGVAEALLIGYRNDLDKDLVQAYSNTGVVHIIAISGLHLGLIYGSLMWLLRGFNRKAGLRVLKCTIILTILWLFTLVAGAAPSIMRSAVMFTSIIVAELISRRQNILQSLALSATIMLCYNPFFLWDVGFQLSYAAVLSIVLFAQPITHWFYFKNKSLNAIWKLFAITLAAQVLTTPIVCYHFHRFPNLFFITNLLAVPLSTIILYGELLLLLLQFVAPIGWLLGKVLGGLIWFMNWFIEQINLIPFNITDDIQLSIVQTIIAYGMVVSFAYWLQRRYKPSFFAGLSFTVVFAMAMAVDRIASQRQNRVVVYNVSRHTAIDFISGSAFYFAGDSAVQADDYLRNFHLYYSRVLFGVQQKPMNNILMARPFYVFNNKKLLLIDKHLRFEQEQKVPVDIIVLAKNTPVSISQLYQSFDCKMWVFDASNSARKINQWKKDCDSLLLPHYSIPDQGALVMNW